MLDFNHSDIVALVEDRGWLSLSEEEKIKSIYNFVKDEILFGYNSNADDMSASRVLKEKVGNGNTKATLFMALLRSVNVPCRIRAFTIDKKIHNGGIGYIAYCFLPREIFHTWTEVFFNDNWIDLEGLILDKTYLESVQMEYKTYNGPLHSFAIGTDNLQQIQVEWTGSHTYVQRSGIIHDFGTFNSPDEFHEKHNVTTGGIKKFLYQKFLYKLMNKNVSKIRNGEVCFVLES